MLTKIKCSKCGADNTFSLSDPMYVGPFKCYKCHTVYKITMEHNVLKSCEPIDPNELAKRGVRATGGRTGGKARRPDAPGDLPAVGPRGWIGVR